MGGALGGIVRQNWTFHFSCVAWSGNWERIKINVKVKSSEQHESGELGQNSVLDSTKQSW